LIIRGARPILYSSLSLLLSVCALHLPAAPSASAAQQTSKPDVARLRKLFVSAFGEDLELLSDEVKDMGVSLGRYWLVRVRPKRTGFFIVRYSNLYRLKNTPLPFIDHEIHIKVAERGCRRSLMKYRAYAYLCLGDSLLVPVGLNDSTSLKFSRTSAEERIARQEAEAAEEPEAPDFSGLDNQPVENPVETYLKYLGRGYNFMSHRDLAGITVVGNAAFQARTPGRLNLRLTARAPDRLKPYIKSEYERESVPVIILPDGAPLTLIAPQERTVSYDERNQPRVYNSQVYQVSVLFLQPGDTLKVAFFAERWRRDTKEWETIKPLVKEVEPVIGQLPFAFKGGYSYDDWLINYLPS
jgi:hypothetical protein